MPPPTIAQDADRRSRRTCSSAGSPPGPSISRTGRSSRPSGPRCPTVKNAAWVRNPIDRFILAKLEEQGLQPAPEADRRTLARRLSLDLTGLPPRPADVEAFVNDTSPDAYEQARRPAAGVARTGASTAAATGSTPPATPTRTASTSTTSARSGRTATGSSTPSTATCRSTSSRSSSSPATCLPNRTLDQQIASGFNRCNITTNEGGAIAEEYLVLYTRDRTETSSQVWLGLTAGCAVCHDHKFDPLTPARVLRAGGVLQQHDAGRDGRQHQGHAADRLRARRRPTATAGPRIADRAGRRCSQRIDGAQAGGPRRVREVAAREPDIGDSLDAGLMPASEELRLQRGGWARVTTGRASDGTRQGPATQPASPRESPTPATSTKGPGVLLRRLGQDPEGRPDRLGHRPHGRPARLPRLGPLARERPGRHAHHPQVAGRRAQGRRSRRDPAERRGLTSSSPTTARRKAAGVKIYINGEPQADRDRRPTA